MSRHKNRNALLSGSSGIAETSSAKDELMAMMFSMRKPMEPVYPLDDKLPEKTYPDYMPWNEDDSNNEKLTNAEYLNNGYFKPPQVSNEYFSARNLIQETLFSSPSNCTNILQELSLNLTKSYKTRHEVINKIRLSSNNFKLPPRVTLTASKKEAWLRDLANPDLPLKSVSSKIPHGIRNKVLIDSMCSMNVPLSKAIWFTKCVLCSEQMLLQKKFQARRSSISATFHSSSLPSIDLIESRWLQEWTSQVTDYLLKFSREMPSITTPDKRSAYQSKLTYLLSFTSALYIEQLIDKSFFLTNIIQLLSEGLPFSAEHLPELLEVSKVDVGEYSPALEQFLREWQCNPGQLLVALTLVKIYWIDILEEDFLCKTLSELLLLNYFLVERLPVSSYKSISAKQALHSDLSSSLQNDVLQLIATSVCELFQHNSNAFIIPNFWVLTGEILYRILTQCGSFTDPKLQEGLTSILRLINFRNESLMLNMRFFTTESKSNSNSKLTSIRRAASMSSEKPSGFLSEELAVASNGDVGVINRTNDDNLKFIEHLDKLNLKSYLTEQLQPRHSSTLNKDGDTWKVKLKLLIYWCVSEYRSMGDASEKILIVCNFVKKRVLQTLPSKGSASLKAEFENEIFESIFTLAQQPKGTIRMDNLFVLINELYQLKVISISSYLRKIIACGIFYISSSKESTANEENPEIQFHLAIISNLPSLTNKQLHQILSKWTDNSAQSSSNFERGVEICKSNILGSLVSNTFPDSYDEFLHEIRTFSVGVKYLLSNWLTSQIKSTINQSPKLIRISLSTIANIYRFYLSTNTLSTFFRVLVKFVLKNENKIIIYYLDTLYFICRLVRHHFLLVNFIAGSSTESHSVAYDIYTLLVNSYDDLSSREADLYNFKSIWEFMNTSVEKKQSPNVASGNHKSTKLFRKTIFSKQTVESPLKIQAPNTNSSDNVSPGQLTGNLSALLASESKTLSNEEIQDILGEVETVCPDWSLTQFTSKSSAAVMAEQVLVRWLENDSDKLDSSFCKLFEILARSSKLVDRKAVIKSAILPLFEPDAHSRNCKFLIKLLVFEILSFADLIVLLREPVPNQAALDYIQFDLMIACQVDDYHLSTSQATTFRILQTEYQSKYVEDIIMLIINHMENEQFMNRNRETILSHIMVALTHFKSWTINLISSKCSVEMTLNLCQSLLGLSEPVDDPVTLSHVTNEFSLPIIQLALRVISLHNTSSVEFLKTFSLETAKNSSFPFGRWNSFYGEMFNYLQWEDKVALFIFLEDMFLNVRSVFTFWLNGTFWSTDGSMLMESQEARESLKLLPVLKDVFKKFTISSSEALHTSYATFQRYSELLENLVAVIDNDTVMSQEEHRVHDIISIFLRLLVIHNASLTEILAKHDSMSFQFLQNLVALLNSQYLNYHEKLKILLYDLLLLMKGALTQALSVTNNDDIIGVSPGALNIAASHDEKNDKKDSPIDSTQFGILGGSAITSVTSILTLAEPYSSKVELGQVEHQCLITLDKDELRNSSDISFINGGQLMLCSKERDSVDMNDPFAKSPDHSLTPFNINSVRVIEDTTEGLNNGCISLSMFDAYTTNENPY